MTTMIICAHVLDPAGERIYEGTTKINANGLVTVAKSRETFVKERGHKFAADGFPVLAGELVKALRTGELGNEIDSKAMSLAVLAWLHDSLFCSVSFDEFRHSTLDFTVYASGAVMYQRIKN